jgi:hypothetical protein
MITAAEKRNPTSHLADSRRLEDLNNPLVWYRTINPPLVNRQKWQKRIDEITELTVRKQSKILLRWAWESSYRMFGRTRQRYNFLTLPVNGVETDFSIPRWVIEERIEPEQIRASWESNRYILDPSTVVNDVDPETGKIRKVIHAGDRLDKGECPSEWFRNLWIIADHDQLCCQKAEEMNRACWGYYRHPDERDIQKVRRIHSMKVKDESFNQSPFEVLTPETLEASAKSAFEATEKRKEQVNKETDARLDDFFRLHLDGFADGKPKPFVYLKQTEGGIYLPD